MSELPVDTIADILSRLPVKSLVQFKCVCKHWQALISNRYFIRAHFNRQITINNPNPLLLMYNDYRSGKEVYSVRCADSPYKNIMNLDPPSSLSSVRGVSIRYVEHMNLYTVFHDHLKLVGSCNGLLCFTETLRCCHDNICCNNIYLWNPSISEFRTLPISHSFSQICDDFSLGHEYLAFGFDDLNEDYEVIRIVYIYEVKKFQVEVYSLKKDCWKKIDDTVSSQISDAVSSQLDNRWHSNPVVVNGSAHWIVKYSRTLSILSFNMANEVFGEISMLDSLSSKCMRLGSLKGRLCVFSYQSFRNCEIWVMKEYGVVQSWTRHHVITEQAVTSVLYVPLQLMESGELLIATSSGELISYDPKSEKVEDFGICFGPYSCDIATYVESLVSIKRVTGGSSSRIDWRANNGMQNEEERRRRRGVLKYLIPWSFLTPMYDYLIRY